MLKHMCAWCWYTRGNPHTEGVLNVHRDPSSSPNIHRHTHTRYNTNATSHGDRQRERQRHKEDRDTERGEDRDTERGEDKTREKRRQDEREEKRREQRSREDQDEREERRDAMSCVWLCGFDFSCFLFSKLPDTRIISNLQNYQPW